MDVICCKHDTRDDDDESNGSFEDGKILECDYNTTCTKLYKLMEGKSWDEIIYFLETGKWYFDATVFTSFFFGTGPDPRFIESRTWVTALDETGSVRWCQLPLHAAITFQAPFEVVKKLVEVYPESIRCADDQDMLPLHYAFRFGSEDKVLAYILEEFPQALKKKALRDRLPLDMAHYSSKPERGVIIECYVETSIAEAKSDWEDGRLLSIKGTKSAEYELMEAKKNIQKLEEMLQSRRSSSRLSMPSFRGGKEKRDVESFDVAEVSVDKKQKGFGKMFGRQKKALVF
jgi:hypothetical protein